MAENLECTCAPELLNTLATRPGEHTMGSRLGDYVLPKVPVSVLSQVRGDVYVYGNQSLGLLVGGEKRTGKLFNWRRPFFTVRHGLLHCVVAPGQDYTKHYARLVATACELIGIDGRIDYEQPRTSEAFEFVDRWLPTKITRSDVVVLGYVERLFVDRTDGWILQPGFGWRTGRVGRSTVTLIGCEFSYWGDLAGGVVTVLAQREVAPWVIYVGKLGTLIAGRAPNEYVATGTTSRVETHEISWLSRLKVNNPNSTRILTSQRHITVPSTLQETLTWYEEMKGSFDLVDPEIGRMALAAQTAGVSFDYLHIVSDNLSGEYREGLYDERMACTSAKRQQCLTIIESILERSFA